VTDREHLDVVIVGAGLAGVGAACNLGRAFPQRSYAVLESRHDLGGTWSLFRYPGVRSDSDMYTLGYRFKPWIGDKALADAPAILDYIREAARENGVEPHIRYRHRVTAARWSSPDQRWTLEVDNDGTRVEATCDFLWSCAGYYDYERPYAPEFPGIDEYAGTVVHPQLWPDELDYAGKRVVVIGSGATAVTLVPAMADTAAHVTMLQRTPTYVVSIPARDPIARRLQRLLPEKLAYRITRRKNVAFQLNLYRLSQRFPDAARKVIRRFAVRSLPEGYEVDTHFSPPYKPWDQRMCLVPDGDLFRSISEGTASVVTDTIENFTEKGIRLDSGDELEADIVVTATGLNLKVMAGLEFMVDGEEVKLPEVMAYKAMMLSGVPNFAFTIGYTNAAWTLKADLVSDYVCRLLAHMDERGLRTVVAVPDPDVEAMPFLQDFTPGYVTRSLAELPRQGSREPWKLRQSYHYDRRRIQKGAIDDGVLEFQP
jgi:monooxygenase